MADAGLEASGDVEVVVTEGSGEGGLDASAIDQLGGVHVECRLPAGDGGSVRADVIASPEPGTAALFLPLLQHALEATADEVEDILGHIEETGEGEPVDLGTGAPVAIARLDVGDAESAALFVSGEDGPTPEQTRAVIRELLG